MSNKMRNKLTFLSFSDNHHFLYVFVASALDFTCLFSSKTADWLSFFNFSEILAEVLSVFLELKKAEVIDFFNFIKDFTEPLSIFLTSVTEETEVKLLNIFKKLWGGGELFSMKKDGVLLIFWSFNWFVEEFNKSSSKIEKVSDMTAEVRAETEQIRTVWLINFCHFNFSKFWDIRSHFLKFFKILKTKSELWEATEDLIEQQTLNCCLSVFSTDSNRFSKFSRLTSWFEREDWRRQWEHWEQQCWSF